MMRKFTDIISEKLDLTPEQKKRRNALKVKRREWLARGKDVTEIDRELAELEGMTISNTNTPIDPQSAQPAPPSGPTKKPAGSSKDWDEGYKAAIEAIKKSKKQKGKQAQQGDTQSDLAGIPMDPDEQQGQQGQQGSSGSGGDEQQGQQGQQGSSGSGSKNQSTRNGKKEGEGVVRPEDCSPMSAKGDLSKTPGTAGGMMSKATGDKLAEAEGYDKESGSDDSVAKTWKDRALKAASQMAGKNPGYEKLRATIIDIFKSTTDWKKELKKIVGQCISPDEGRQAYANKNILISQDRVARTTKDKYDSMSYMVAAIDTSGSMTQDYLNQCLAEVYQVALAKKPLKLVIMQFDTRVADIQEFTNLNDLKKNLKNFELKGGGGTDVKCVFDKLQDKKDKYSKRPAELLMIFTDGYLDQYKRLPKQMKSLIWVIVNNPGFVLKYKDIQTKCVRIKMEN